MSRLLRLEAEYWLRLVRFWKTDLNEKEFHTMCWTRKTLRDDLKEVKKSVLNLDLLRKKIDPYYNWSEFLHCPQVQNGHFYTFNSAYFYIKSSIHCTAKTYLRGQLKLMLVLSCFWSIHGADYPVTFTPLPGNFFLGPIHTERKRKFSFMLAVVNLIPLSLGRNEPWPVRVSYSGDLEGTSGTPYGPYFL